MKIQKMNFCETCAQKQGINDPSGFAFAELLLGFGLSQDLQAPNECTCSVCGLTQSQFKKTGRLGCSACYDLFIEELTPMLRNMHPSLLHVGKVPRLFAQEQKKKEATRLLEEQLQSAIAKEDYETAAQLRDKISSLQGGSVTTSSREPFQPRGVQKLFPFEVAADGSSIKSLS